MSTKASELIRQRIAELEAGHSYGNFRAEIDQLTWALELVEAQERESELGRLRSAQDDAVMPLIGPLLDAYEGIPNDLRDDQDLEELFEQLGQIRDAMESAGDEEDDDE